MPEQTNTPPGRPPGVAHPGQRTPWYERNAVWIDSLLTAGVVLVVAAAYGASSRDLALSLALLAPLAVRRRFPVVSVVLVYLAGVPIALTGSDVSLPVGIVAVPVALYSVTLHGPRWAYRTAFISGLAGCALLSAGVVMLSGDPTGEGFVTGTVVMFTMSMVLVTAWAFGLMRRSRRDTIAALLDRADRAERERDQQALLATAAERTRIAREMHDIVAHSVSVMIALSDGATAALDRAPDRSREALHELSRTGRSALADMQRVLGALDPEGPEPMEPTETELPTIIDRFRAAGLPVTATGLDALLAADTSVRLALVRIVSEALTNVLRHAPGTRSVTVTVRRADARIHAEVVDTGASMPGPGGGTGRGIVGMRERAALLGGHVDAGPAPHGGWRVHVTLPTGPAQEEER